MPFAEAINPEALRDRDNNVGECITCGHEYGDNEILILSPPWNTPSCPNCRKGDRRISKYCQNHPAEAPHHPTERCEN